MRAAPHTRLRPAAPAHPHQHASGHAAAAHRAMPHVPVRRVSEASLLPPTPPANATPFPPINQGDQGLSAVEASKGEKLLSSLLTAPGIQMVATFWQPGTAIGGTTGVYEIRSSVGHVRFTRERTPDGKVWFRIVDQVGPLPWNNDDPHALATLGAEISAAGSVDGPVPADKNSFPEMFRRVSQLFDSTRAPDLVYIPTPGGDPNHPKTGSHGVPDMIQSRAPMILAGPGIAHQVLPENVIAEDVAPTIAQYMGMQPQEGIGPDGRLRMQYLHWQDGNSFAAAIASSPAGVQAVSGAAKQACVFVLDGEGNDVLMDEIAKGHLPNIAALMGRGTTMQYGSLVEYPTVTYANHNTLLTGASPGHQGILNNYWYDRATKVETSPSEGLKTSFKNGRFMDPRAETLYEASNRSFPGSKSYAANEPSSRGASVALLEFNGIGDILKTIPHVISQLWKDWKSGSIDPRYRWMSDYRTSALQDSMGAAMYTSMVNRGQTPKFAAFEFAMTDSVEHAFGPHSEEARAALQEADRKIGTILASLKASGQYDSTMFVVTADHGQEHQDGVGAGGWERAIAASGVRAIESTRFVYIKSMSLTITGGQQHVPGGTNISHVNVLVRDDDADAKGVREGIANAHVRFVDQHGKVVAAAVTDDKGVASVSFPPGYSEQLTVVVEQGDFTTERATISVG